MARRRKAGRREANGRLQRQRRSDPHAQARLRRQARLVGRDDEGRVRDPALAADPLSLMVARDGLGAEMRRAGEVYEHLYRFAQGRVDPVSACHRLGGLVGPGWAAAGDDEGRERFLHRRFRQAGAALLAVDGGQGRVKNAVENMVVFKHLPDWLMRRIDGRPASPVGSQERARLLAGLAALAALFQGRPGGAGGQRRSAPPTASDDERAPGR